ncbi:MAG: dTMP kinase [Candidatus Methanogranum gryphiswaldense]|jgi:dTMP kinase|nr:MAG: dTMP kinase [Candidatus Methanogranum sp. U3.2.1]
MTGAFIVFEGIDGSGKTSICERVRVELEKNGKHVMVTQEPTHDEIGTFIRSGIVSGISQRAEALLFVADRAVHTDRIRKLIEDEYIVICDRYFASTVAYQSAPLDGVALDQEWLLQLNSPVIRMPEITFLLDIDAEKSMKRVINRGEKSKFENIEYQRCVRSNYIKLAKQFNFVIIDADRIQDEVLEDIMKVIWEVI